MPADRERLLELAAAIEELAAFWRERREACTTGNRLVRLLEWNSTIIDLGRSDFRALDKAAAALRALAHGDDHDPE